MPRALDPTLEAALDSGNFSPYFLVTVREVGFAVRETATPTYFKLSGINLTVKWKRLAGSVYGGFNYPHQLEFKITRGVTIQGVNYTIDSSWYFGVTQTWNGIFQTVTACMLPETKYTAAGDVTYQEVIDDLCAAYNKTATYRTVGAAWQSYQFLGAGKTVNLNRANSIVNMLRQKYLIYACDNGNDEILFSAIGTEPAASNDHEMDIAEFTEFGSDVAGYRRFLYRDEAGTIHYDGNADDPLWNLGYLESTASAPTTNFSYPFTLKPIAPHLKYLSFDKFHFSFEKNYPASESMEAFVQMQVEEEFNYEHNEIPWRINLSSFDWSKGTEGGALPGTIEAAAPYTPLNTSHFDNILSAKDNNIQAALETLDEHEHGSSVPIDTPTATNDFLVGEQVATVWTWVKKTLAQTITILRTSLDSIYAASSHTHSIPTTEEIQDIVGAMLTGIETGIAASYDDANARIDLVAEVTQAELDAHVNDAADAHDASAISITDTGGHYTGTDVETALQEAALNEIVFLTDSNEFFRFQTMTLAIFTATINGAPSGATLVYNAPSAGAENELAQYDGTGAQTANNLCGIVLRNTTRGTEAIISNVNLATNTITLTANVPAGWASGDTITTDAGLGSSFRAAEIKSTSVIPSGATQLLLFVQVVDTAGSIQAWIQEYTTFAAAKTWVVAHTAGANLGLTSLVTVPLTSRRILYQVRSPAGNTATLLARIIGYKKG